MQRGTQKLPQLVARQTPEDEDSVIQYFIQAAFCMLLNDKNFEAFLKKATLLKVATKEVLLRTNEKFCERLEQLIESKEQPNSEQDKTKWCQFFDVYLKHFFLPRSDKVLEKPQKMEGLARIKKTNDKLMSLSADSKPKPPLVAKKHDYIAEMIKRTKQKYEDKLQLINKLNDTINLLDEKEQAEAKKIRIYRGEMFQEMKNLNELCFTLIKLNLPEKNSYLDKIINNLELRGIFALRHKDYKNAINFFDELLEVQMNHFLEASASPKMVEVFIKKLRAQALLFKEEDIAITEAELAKNELIFEKLNCKDLLSPLVLFVFFKIQMNQEVSSMIINLRTIIDLFDNDTPPTETACSIRKTDKDFLTNIFNYFCDYMHTTKKCHEDLFGLLMLFKKLFQKFSATDNADLIVECDQQRQTQLLWLLRQVVDLSTKIQGLGEGPKCVNDIESLVTSVTQLDEKVESFSQWGDHATLYFLSDQKTILTELKQLLEQERERHKHAKEALKKDKEKEKKQERMRNKTQRRIDKKAEKIAKINDGAQRVHDRAALLLQEGKQYLTELQEMKLPKFAPLLSFAAIKKKQKELQVIKTELHDKHCDMQIRLQSMVTDIEQELKNLAAVTEENTENETLCKSLKQQIENLRNILADVDRDTTQIQEKINGLIAQVAEEHQKLLAQKAEYELEQAEASEFLKSFFKDTLGSVNDLIFIANLFDSITKKCPSPAGTDDKSIDLYLKGGITLRFGLWGQDKEKCGWWLPAPLKDYDLGIAIDHFPSAKTIQDDLLGKKFTAKSINNSRYAGHIESKQDFRFAGFVKDLTPSTLAADVIVMYRENYVPNPLHYLAQGMMRIWRGKSARPLDVDPTTVTPFMPGFYLGLVTHVPFQAACRYLVTHSCIILNSPQEYNTNVIGFSAKCIQKSSDIVRALTQPDEKPKKPKCPSTPPKELTFKWYDVKKHGPLTMDFLQKDASPALALAELEEIYCQESLQLLKNHLDNELYRWTAELVAREISLTAPIVVFFVRGFFKALIEFNHNDKKLTPKAKNIIVDQIITNVERYCEQFPDDCSVEMLSSRFDKETARCVATFQRQQQKPQKFLLASGGLYGKPKSPSASSTPAVNLKNNIVVHLPKGQ